MKPLVKAIVAEPSDVVRRALGQMLRSRGINTAEAPSLQAARAYLKADAFDLLLASLDQADGDGEAFLEDDARRFPSRKRVLVWPESRGLPPDGISADEILMKPFGDPDVRALLQRLRQRQAPFPPPAPAGAPESLHRSLLGHSPAMRQLQQLIQQVAQTDATVLIQGESGTGKELIARALHQQSRRARGPFVSVNCAALPETLIESELFGHEKGSFTGALSRREGRFELANGGTLLLDEITEVSAAVQAKLLRVLQEREFERVGGNHPVTVDVRVVATSNRNLEEAVSSGLFREDLYFRLNVVPLHVPPLRERLGDVRVLAEHFLQVFRAKYGSPAQGLTPAALTVLEAHPWPGNVRELQNVMERAVITCLRPLIEPAHLHLRTRPQPVPAAPPPGLPPAPDLTAALPWAPGPPVPVAVPLPRFPAKPALPQPSAPHPSLPTGDARIEPHPRPLPEVPVPAVSPGVTEAFVPRTLEEVEREHILRTLEFTRGNRNQAARILEVNIRTLRNKLNAYHRQVQEGPTPSRSAKANGSGVNALHGSEYDGPEDA